MNFLHFLKLAFLIFVFVFPRLLNAQDLDSRVGDEQFLQDFANSTSIGWSTFNLSNPPSGVTVQQIGGELRITEVDVAFQGITGTIPASIGNLTKMTHWKSKQNNLSGRIPDTIGNLRSLVWFSLASGMEEDIVLDKSRYNHPGKGSVEGSSFTGGLPDVFHNLQNLQLIEARDAGLTGTLPPSIGQASNLKGIFLDSNDIGGDLPISWGNLSNLHHLGIRHNSLTGQIPVEWANGLVELSYVWFEGNDLEGDIPEFASDDIWLFYASKMSIGWTGEFPAWILDGRNKYLNTFNLGHSNSFTGGLPETIGGAESHDYRYITVFSVGNSGDGLTGPLPDWILGMTGMIQLQLQNNDFSGELPLGMIDAFKRLRLFYIPNNNFEGSLPTGEWTKSILDIQFQGNKFSGGIPASWETLKNTSRPLKVNLSGNNLEGVIPEFFKDVGTQGGGSLDVLSVQNNKFTPKDILPFRTEIENAAKTYNYLPQNGFGIKVTLAENSTIDRSSFDYSGNRYQWYRNGIELSGETSYTIDTSSHGTGTYVLEIIHPDIDFIFESEPVEVKIGGDDSGNENSGNGPHKISPAKDEKSVSKKTTFKWESVEEADSYTIEVREASTSSLLVGEEVKETVFVTSTDLKQDMVYLWRVRATVQGQTGEWSDEWQFTTEDGNEEVAFEVELNQNYPNPFNPSTNIKFTLAEQQDVSLKVYDMAGRLVASLIDGSTLSAGTHNASFNAQSLASGIYFYRLITPGEIVTRKMTLMK